ncbi:unnamed protein product [Linum trigynum]|uniref:Uncharacterized protein n=1 Tax=Linum trigynum TaxID=586398 RepID=A0AAV2FQZ7_9ROSI
MNVGRDLTMETLYDEGINTKEASSPTLVREGRGPITRSQDKAFRGRLQAYLAQNFTKIEADLFEGREVIIIGVRAAPSKIPRQEEETPDWVYGGQLE